MVTLARDPWHVPLDRAALRPADVLLARGRGLVSWRIALRGRGPWSHAALVARCAEQWLINEVREWYGGRLVTLDSQVREQPGRIDVYRYRFGLTEEQTRRITATMAGFAGRRYGYWRVLQAGLTHTWLLSALRPPTLAEAQNGLGGPLFCSQAVSLAYVAAGIDLVPNLASQYTEPADLARSGLLRYVCTLDP